MTYGDKRDYRKIDLYDRVTGSYLGSTTWASNLKTARVKLAEALDRNFVTIRARYAK